MPGVKHHRIDELRRSDFVSYRMFAGLAPVYGTVDGGDAPATNTEIGLDADSDGSILTKTSATARRFLLGSTEGGSGRYMLNTSGATRETQSGTVAGNFVAGLNMAAGSLAYHQMPIPRHWSRKHPIRVRAHWLDNSGAAAVDDSTTWIFLYSKWGLGEAVTLPTTALDTAIGATDRGSTVAETTLASGWGVINAGGFGQTDSHFSISLEMDATDSNEVLFRELEFEYTPRFSRGVMREASLYVTE